MPFLKIIIKQRLNFLELFMITIFFFNFLNITKQLKELKNDNKEKSTVNS